jgi:predicted small metal-binding protein
MGGHAARSAVACALGGISLIEGGQMARKYIDCREMPSENNCDLAMAGSEEHVLNAAVIHAVTAHGHEDTPELREEIRGALKDEVPGALV